MVKENRHTSLLLWINERICLVFALCMPLVLTSAILLSFFTEQHCILYLPDGSCAQWDNKNDEVGIVWSGLFLLIIILNVILITRPFFSSRVPWPMYKKIICCPILNPNPFFFCYIYTKYIRKEEIQQRDAGYIKLVNIFSSLWLCLSVIFAVSLMYPGKDNIVGVGLCVATIHLWNSWIYVYKVWKYKNAKQRAYSCFFLFTFFLSFIILPIDFIKSYKSVYIMVKRLFVVLAIMFGLAIVIILLMFIILFYCFGLEN